MTLCTQVYQIIRLDKREAAWNKKRIKFSAGMTCIERERERGFLFMERHHRDLAVDQRARGSVLNVLWGL